MSTCQYQCALLAWPSQQCRCLILSFALLCWQVSEQHCEVADAKEAQDRHDEHRHREAPKLCFGPADEPWTNHSCMSRIDQHQWRYHATLLTMRPLMSAYLQARLQAHHHSWRRSSPRPSRWTVLRRAGRWQDTCAAASTRLTVPHKMEAGC